MIGTNELIERVATLLRDTASHIVMPRFRALMAADITEKSPGDVVTIADRKAEAAITAALVAIDRECRVVGEEAVALNPALMSGLDRGRVWLVDPIDGTANYAAGRTPFAIMVALLEAGDPVAAWILDPVSGSLAIAERGGGAWIDGRRITTTRGGDGADTLRGAIFGKFMPPEIHAATSARSGAFGAILPGYMCCGAEYPAIATGTEDFALFWRTLPWDHAPGALFLTEAGGHVARPDGEAYRPASGARGLLAARCAESWSQAHAVLFG